MATDNAPYVLEPRAAETAFADAERTAIDVGCGLLGALATRIEAPRARNVRLVHGDLSAMNVGDVVRRRCAAVPVSTLPTVGCSCSTNGPRRRSSSEWSALCDRVGTMPTRTATR